MPSMRSSLETSNPSLSSLLRLVREEFDAYKNTKEDEMVVVKDGNDIGSSSRTKTLISYRIDRGFEYVALVNLHKQFIMIFTFVSRLYYCFFCWF